jgi:sec-independent protein translocase protein TatC
MTVPSELETSEQNSNNNLEKVSAENSIAPVADDLMAVNNLEGAEVSPENIAPAADDSMGVSNLEGAEVCPENSISTVVDDSTDVSNLEDEEVNPENSIVPVADDLIAVNNLEDEEVNPENSISTIADDSTDVSNSETEEVSAENSIAPVADDFTDVSNLEDEEVSAENSIAPISDDFTDVSNLEDEEVSAENSIAPIADSFMGSRNLENEYLDELPDEVEMSLFDHLEELRQRLFYSLIAVAVGVVGCFLTVKPIVQLLEVPAGPVKFLQLAPGEYFFVSIEVAGYSGLLIASPFIFYQIALFVLPGLTRKERRLLGPVFFGSSFLFLGGLVFAYIALIPAALNFFVTYGADVVEQLWSIDKYFKFVLLLMFSTGLAFQIPIVQVLLGVLGIVSSKKMLSGWRYVVLGAAVLGAVLTPSTDPLTQSLLGGAVLALYFGGVGLVKLLGR